ncbi:MAG: hypothetical protein ACP5H5_02590, partial [Pyrobaculum sp.]
MEVRSLIKLRGSYLIYLPKKVVASYYSDKAVIYWEGDFIGVRQVEPRRAETSHAGVLTVVAGFAAGLDELVVPQSREVEKALEKIYAKIEYEGDVVKIRYEDRYINKDDVVRRMLQTLLYLLEGLAGGTATRRVVEAADDESDVLRLTVNRLCAKWPTPRCAFYIQLARYYERAVDHIRELYLSESQPEMWAALLEAARELAEIHERRTVDHIAKFLSTAASKRFQV